MSCVLKNLYRPHLYKYYFDCCVTYFKDHIDPSPMDTLTGLQQQQSNDSVESQVDEASGVLIGMASGRMEVKVKVKQTETIPGPKVIDSY